MAEHPIVSGLWQKARARFTTVDTATTTIDGYHDVPTKDATSDSQMRDVIGKKDDTARTTAGTTRSIMSYIKGVLNTLGTPTDTDTSTDIANVQTGVDAIPTNKRCEFEQIADTHTGDYNEQTLLNIASGSGILYDVMIKVDAGATVDMRIIMDGETHFVSNLSNTEYRGLMPAGSNALQVTGTNFLPYALNWEYQDSLLIKYSLQDDNTKTAYIAARYGHD